MIRLLLQFGVLFLLALAFTWMANQPGTMSVTWLGYQIDEIPVYFVIGLFLLLFFVLWFAWWLIRLVFGTPGALGDFFRMRRSRKGIDALSRGMVAVSAGDAAIAHKQALLAKKLVADSPLAHLLEAQAAQLRGDNSRVSQIYKQMLDDPETEVVALRGLYVAARKEGDEAAARDYAERANQRDGSLAWASRAMAGYLSTAKDWPAVAGLIERQRKAGVIDRDQSNSKRAVVLTAQAMAVEDSDPEAAIDLATKAHKLDAGLVPAAVIAGRALAGHGSLRRACNILEKTWKQSPHPAIAETYVHARMGDSAQDRLRRVKDLLRVRDGGIEGAIALANVAIDARDWTGARKALEAFSGERPPVRLCMLMAEIEEGEFGDKGKAREWLSRAVRAPRDPAWTADGYVSEEWQPVSPVTGELGAFAWKVPLTRIGAVDEAMEIEPVIEAGTDEIEAPVVGEEAEIELEAAVAEPDAVEAGVVDLEPEPEPEAEPLDEAAEATETSSEAASEESQLQAVDEAATEEDAPADAEPPDGSHDGANGSEVADRLAELRQPDDPGPRKDNQSAGRKSWFG